VRNPEHEAGQVTPEPLRAKLSHRERSRFERALEILEGGGGALALAKAGVVVAGPGVCEALLARAWAVRHSDADEMLKLTHAAVQVAAQLDRRYGERFAARLQARAWGGRANACRIAGLLDSADKALAEAGCHAARAGDRLLLVWLADLEATLLGCSRKLAPALEALESCRQLYEELGERHLAGRTLVTQAVFAFASGDPVRALQLNGEGSLQLDPKREPDLPELSVRNHLLFEAALTQLSPGPGTS
jgi:hypothetical protein